MDGEYVLYKLLKAVRLEEQKKGYVVQKKGLSPRFVSLFARLVLSLSAAMTFSLLVSAFVASLSQIDSHFSIQLMIFSGLGLVSALILMISSNKIIKIDDEQTVGKKGGIKFWVSFLITVIFPFLLLILFSAPNVAFAWSVVLPALGFSLVLALATLLAALVKFGGIDKTWTLDRATGAEKVVVSLWVFFLMLAICFTLIYLRVNFGGYSFRDFLERSSPTPVLLVITLFVVFFVSNIKTIKAYRSRMEEFAIKEGENELMEKVEEKISKEELKKAINELRKK